MVTGGRNRPTVGDPLLFAVERDQPISLEVLERAIVHREHRINQATKLVGNPAGDMSQLVWQLVDEWQAEIHTLKHARTRLARRVPGAL